MNVLQLRYFITVAQLENVSKAAAILHLSQSSLSKNIAKLEEDLGLPLFERNGKKIKLNPAGERFLDACTLVLRELDGALADMHQLTWGTDKRIRIGLADTNRRMIDCIAAFRAEHPDVEFDLDSNIEGDDMIDINDFDVLVYPSGGRYNKFSGYAFYQERFYIAASATHPLSKSVSLLPQALADQNVVFLRKGKNAFEYPYRICGALAINFASKCFADSRALHREIVASGLAVGFVPEEELSFYRNSSDIRLYPVHDQRFIRQIMVCFRREKHLTAPAREFRDHMIRYFSLTPED